MVILQVVPSRLLHHGILASSMISSHHPCAQETPKSFGNSVIQWGTSTTRYNAAGTPGGFGIPGGQGQADWSFSSISRPQGSYLASTLIPPFGATGLSAIGNQAPSGSSALGGYGVGAMNHYGGLGDIL